MISRVATLFCTTVFILFFIFPVQAATTTKEYVGHWRGLLCKGRMKQSARLGLSVVHKDIGHQVESFEFDIEENGTISGKGVASYWFDVFVPINLVLSAVDLESHLEGGVRRVKFNITGSVQKEGLLLRIGPEERLPRVTAGRKEWMDAWNIFSGNPAAIYREEGKTFVGWKGIIQQLGMDLEWKAVKEGLAVEVVKMGSPNNSFISTDELQFRAHVEGVSDRNSSIDWKSEDGRVEAISSGTLTPVMLHDSPNYPASPPLKPNPFPAPNGRKGKLSYKITASETLGHKSEEASVVIQQDEIDQVRQEYVDMQKAKVPLRDEFAQNGGAYNTGDYAWSISSPKMVAGYQIIQKNYAPSPAQINSAYRNPIHNLEIGGQLESRHIYGDAVDIQTVSIGHHGRPNESDWEKLVTIAKTANPSWIEPYKLSGAGHVHVDWR